MDLPALWFALVALLWTGYLALEGFDFGVGMLTRRFARDEAERRVLLATIGPVWDGNEVWLIAAVGATFAAFPAWYATAFAAYYLPLTLVLLALIGRGVALEYRGKGDTEAWRRRCDWGIFAGSVVPAFVWGVVLAGFVQGLPIDAAGNARMSLADIVTPYMLLGGVTTGTLALLHGCTYVALKADGELRRRAGQLAGRLGGPVALLVAGFLGWTVAHRWADGSLIWLATIVAAAAALATAAAASESRRDREGRAFAATFAGVAGTVIALFAALFPDVLPSTLGTAGGLSVADAAASDYTLGIMTWVAVPTVPVVLAYQGWVYWTFRHRVSVEVLALTARHPEPPAGR
jgi:cytochrome d ubiquinol oxidase subunit II